MAGNPMPLRFHWSIPGSGASSPLRGSQDRAATNPVADLAAQLELCQLADEGGIDQLLLPIGFHRADPIALATYFGGATRRVKFMVAVRPGILSPTYLVQQVNTVSVLTGGRITINVVAGYSSQELRYYGDFLSHDERFQRSDEFWTVCHALWRGGPVDFDGKLLKVEGAKINTPFMADGRTRPELYFGGSSELAADMAIKHGDCQLSLADVPERMAPRIRRVLDSGTEVGVLVSLITRPTHDEAVEVAYGLPGAAGEKAREVQRAFRRQAAESVGLSSNFALGDALGDGDSAWLTPYLWTGAIPYLGPLAIALVGSPDEVADALLEYRRIGVTQFLFHGRPDLETLPFFCSEILPRVRAREREHAAETARA